MFSGHGSGELNYQSFMDKAEDMKNTDRQVIVKPLIWLFGCQSIAFKQMAPTL